MIDLKVEIFIKVNIDDTIITIETTNQVIVEDIRTIMTGETGVYHPPPDTPPDPLLLLDKRIKRLMMWTLVAASSPI